MKTGLLFFGFLLFAATTCLGQVAFRDGIVIAVEDFPSKVAPEPTLTHQDPGCWRLLGASTVQEVRVYDLEGNLRTTVPGNGQSHLEIRMASGTSAGNLWLLHILHQDGRMETRKLFRF